MNAPLKKSGFVICIRGRLDPGRAKWFGAAELVYTEFGNTLLKRPVCDQPALFGILEKVRNLGVELISVRPWDTDAD